MHQRTRKKKLYRRYVTNALVLKRFGANQNLIQNRFNPAFMASGTVGIWDVELKLTLRKEREE